MYSKPLVSIITPTFNRADYLPIAVESVLAQTMPEFELIVIDDGSTDNTSEVMERYTSDSRVRYFKQENQGQSIARNRGIEAAKGDYICFLDSDNAWLETKLSKSLQAFKENPEADIVYGDFILIDEHGKEQGVNRMKRYSGRITSHLIHDNFISMNTTMTRRRCFEEMGGFDNADRLAEDYGLWLRFSTRYQFLYLPEILGYYRVMENQISSDKDSRLMANEQIIRTFLESFPEALSRGEARHGMSRFFVRKGRYELSQGRYRIALADLGKSLANDPLWSGPWRLAMKTLISPVSVRRT
ncbi:glycosyltransferase [Marinobacter nauticus]|jgi:glycosyltransferase involved in cell wall biosynthesis|uniref:Glycosyltransferase involved in cell wall biosynthesis n=1 Tax=Marinobacter nauticus TaxID=2743 RepID=A0A368UVS8_MARNT|nr:glycosyltransferase [Marinobacter nauticus]MBY5961832.1 glycosyltransferase [Marinobacter nauticus]MBY6102806.1 glycosyltransferase [Marinobacter nauticus]RBP71950.1 glycosyltransferase involved in cell wall biosynthesis [Marinobacter nauticus]RCW32968.1 glycosyltransferase involved in cell wall biosynthesis [Marinobacter nauticus]